MSDMSEGPGWWIASDGRWYPPELHPSFPGPPPAPPTLGSTQAPAQWPAQWPTQWPGSPLPTDPGGGRRGSGGLGSGARRALVLSAVLALVLAAVAVGVATQAGPSRRALVPGGGSSTFIAPLTGFAGYHWTGDVQQISARWRVPAIAPGTSVGHASTWIGAQNAEGGPPFIQLGVTEDKFGPGPASYEAFWSDTAVSFHPQPMGPLAPGDLISAAMVRGGTGWSLTLHDATSGATDSQPVAYGRGGTFTAAEWIQEDPTASAVTSVDLPYPKTTTVEFQRLLVNGRPPTLGLDDGQTLTAADGIVLVPSPVRSDGFSLTAPTGAAAQYLADAAKLDAALSRFEVESASWSSTPTATRTVDVDKLAAAYRANATAFLNQSWPSATRPEVTVLGRQLQRVVTDLQAWKAAGMKTSGAVFATLRSDQEIGPLANAARATLGLPPP